MDTSTVLGSGSGAGVPLTCPSANCRSAAESCVTRTTTQSGSKSEHSLSSERFVTATVSPASVAMRISVSPPTSMNPLALSVLYTCAGRGLSERRAGQRAGRRACSDASTGRSGRTRERWMALGCMQGGMVALRWLAATHAAHLRRPPLSGTDVETVNASSASARR